MSEAPHDDLPCRLATDDEAKCPEVAVVSVMDRQGDAEWGCETHAAHALERIHGARINSVADWDAARRLLQLPWNNQGLGL